MKKVKASKVLKVVMMTVFGVTVALFLAMFIMSRVSASPVFLFRKTAMWLMTESMDPTIPPRTYILVEKATADDVEVGDIIVFRSTDPRINGHFNTHRIVEKDGDRIVTKGDHNTADDGPYSAKAENVVGKYVKSLPVLTFLGRIVMTPLGFTVLLILFLATLALGVAPDFKSAMREKEKEDEIEKQKEIRRLIDEEVRRLQESGGVVDPTEPQTIGEGTAPTDESEEQTKGE